MKIVKKSPNNSLKVNSESCNKIIFVYLHSSEDNSDLTFYKSKLNTLTYKIT